MAQALGKMRFFSFSCCCSVLIPTWEHTGTPAWHQCCPLPEVWEVKKKLGEIWGPQSATRSGESSQGQPLLQSPQGKGNSEVMPYKVQHWGSAGWKGEVPNTAVESGTVPEQILCDIVVKGHIQDKKMVIFSKYCSPFKNQQGPSATGTASAGAAPGSTAQGLGTNLSRFCRSAALELSPSPSTDTEVLLMLNGHSWGWMRNAQMRDTKMSDSLPTVVAMRSNSQHQSDKLSDRKVQPWHGTRWTQQLQQHSPASALPTCPPELRAPATSWQC